MTLSNPADTAEIVANETHHDVHNDRKWQHIALVILLLASIVRVWGWWHRPAFWEDEAALAMNVVDRSWSQLTEPPLRDQAAPIGFMALCKAVVTTLPVSERTLRAIPLISAILALWMMHKLTRELAGPVAGVAVLVLMALADPLLYYSREFKPYSSDLAIAAYLLLLASRFNDRELTTRRIVVFALNGALSVWLSFPAAIVLAAAGGCLFVAALLRRDQRKMIAIVVISFIWLISFSIHYFGFMRTLLHNTYLLNFHLHAYMPFPPRSLSDLKWYPGTFGYAFVAPGGLDLRYLAVGLFLVGCIIFLKRSPLRCALLITPIVVALALSAAHKYPFTNRLILFLMPGLLIPIAATIAALWEVRYREMKALAIVLLATLTLRPALQSRKYLAWRTPPRDIPDIVRDLKARLQPGDEIYAQYRTEIIYKYYAARAGITAPYIRGPRETNDRAGDAKDLARAFGHPRVWVLIPTFIPRDGSRPRANYFMDVLEQNGTRRDYITSSTVDLYLFDLSKADPAKLK